MSAEEEDRSMGPTTIKIDKRRYSPAAKVLRKCPDCGLSYANWQDHSKIHSSIIPDDQCFRCKAPLSLMEKGGRNYFEPRIGRLVAYCGNCWDRRHRDLRDEVMRIGGTEVIFRESP